MGRTAEIRGECAVCHLPVVRDWDNAGYAHATTLRQVLRRAVSLGVSVIHEATLEKA